MPVLERHIYKQPPSRGELERMARLLGHPKEMAAVRGKYFKESWINLDKDSAVKIIAAMEAQPRLLRRPLLYNEAGALAGFDEKKYEELLRK